MQSPFVDAQEMAEYLGIGKETVYRLSDPKKTADPIPHLRLGKKLKYRLDSPEMQQWIRRQQRGLKVAGELELK